MLKPIREYGVVVLLALITLIAVLQYRFAPHQGEQRPCVKNAAGEMCLDQSTPYVEVPSANQAPQALTQKPEALQEELPMVQVTYDQLTAEMQQNAKSHPKVEKKPAK